MKRIETSGAGRFLVLVGVLCAAQAWAYDDVYQPEGYSSHSTFHYELVRTLVRAAGLPASMANQVAAASAATDTGTFFGNGSFVSFTGTERLESHSVAVTQYWHFPRRGCVDSHTQVILESATNACNTCTYFSTFDQCDAEGVGQFKPEAHSIDAWAVYGAQNTLTHPVYYSGTQAHVPAGSTHALGIYLHALADSYSHEKCMQTHQLRTHIPGTDGQVGDDVECTPAPWHITTEFNPAADVFARRAAVSIYRTARKYAQLNNLGCALKSEAWVVSTLMPQWLETNTPEHRAATANLWFSALANASCAP